MYDVDLRVIIPVGESYVPGGSVEGRVGAVERRRVHVVRTEVRSSTAAKLQRKDTRC